MRYVWIALAVVCLGILSRKIPAIPLFIGDILYAVMMYFMLRIILLYKKRTMAAILALLFCYVIEGLQLYQAEWMIGLRKTLLGKYILGQGFLWSDLLCYTLGVVLAFWIDEKTQRNV
jgi:hypothetical protein